jgi:DNA-binding PadR family transcriptional regulator
MSCDSTLRTITWRTMPPTLTPLAGALLGLLNEEPRSGYDLRRVFALTPMGHFSDSPGAIYPALRRLRDAGFVASTVEAKATLRPREIYRLTPAGVAALREWATAPPTRDDIIVGVQLVLLRFVLTYSSAGVAAARRFLERFEHELVAYATELREYYRAAAPTMHPGARLGMENGLAVFDTHVRWCRRARRALGAGKGTRQSMNRSAKR